MDSEMDKLFTQLATTLDFIKVAATEPEVSFADYLLIEAIVTVGSICSVNGIVLNQIMKELRKKE